ncbi:proteoglycan 4b isoform X30 [Carassius gibelio]|uniref:proteoglycan 4b isoform X25 n=1 Tax=Carassius gibelio TaxID=101364 RepID=UPI0022796F57|nr:proteoglycan 4b isoform X25 [Carassius gibelio]XP_052442059.1 proteoglycan 4b isoform X26 [Carassius gibelio]XP_052442063.1 proteoglycan 4b isoform X30 [Carassius gibelio]
MATYLSLLLLFAYASTGSSDPSSCKGRCGAGYYRGSLCQCDYECLSLNECCSDFTQFCTTSDSCKGRCGEPFHRSNPCHCDIDCVSYKQCCPDYENMCLVEDTALKPRKTATAAQRTANLCLNIKNKKSTETSNEDMTNDEGTGEPTEGPPSTEPTEDPASPEPTESPPSTEPTESPPSTEPTESPPSTEPTEVPSGTEPTEGPSGTEPTEFPTVEPIESPSSTEPIEVPSNAEPTESPSSTEPTEVPSNAEPTESPSSTEPTEVPSTAEPTGGPPSTAPTEVSSSAEPTGGPPSTAPTEVSSSAEPTGGPPSIAPTEIPLSVEPTEAPLNTAPTEVSSSAEPTEYSVSEMTTKAQSEDPKESSSPRDPSDIIPIKPTEKPLKPISEKDGKKDSIKDYQADDYDSNLCSGRPVSGLTTLRNGTIVVFRGHYFWTLDKQRNPDPPQLITKVWGIPSPIDSVYTRCNCEGKTYFFKGRNYWRFDNGMMDPGFPKSISQGFGQIGHITAALSIPEYRSRKESVIFFRRGGMAQKYTYQVTPNCGKEPKYPAFRVWTRARRQAVSALGPVISISKTWRGFPTIVTSAVSVPSRVKEGYKYYVFSQNKYYSMKMEREKPVILKPATGPKENLATSFFKCPETQKN